MPYTENRGRFPAVVVFFPLLLLIFRAAPARAAGPAERQTFIFSQDREQDLKKLSELSFFKDLTSTDVLWANDIAADALVEGTVLVIPDSKKDLLPVWQSVQKQKKSASGSLVSIKLHGVPRYAQTPVPPSPDAPHRTDNASVAPDTPPQAIKASPVSQEPVRATKPLSVPDALPQSNAPQDAPRSRADVRGGTKGKSEAVDAREPVLFLSPNGESFDGPMRLVISGDTVTVVRLPQSQAPKALRSGAVSRSFLPVPSEPAPSRDSKLLGARMLWPVDGAVSSGFGKRGKRAFHAGIDIPMPKGTPIRAARDGVVKQIVSVKSRGFRGYGNVVILDHGGGISTLYAHCHDIKVKQGKRVRQGEIIGTVGRTGRATTHHVHFEVRVNGKAVDPISYLPPRR